MKRTPDSSSRAPAHARPHVSRSRARQFARRVLLRTTTRARASTRARTRGLFHNRLCAGLISECLYPSRGHSIEHRLKNESCSFLAKLLSCLRVLAGRFFVLHWWDYKNLFEMKNLWVVHNCVWFYCVYPGFFFCFYKFFLCALNQGIFILSYRVLNCRL